MIDIQAKRNGTMTDVVAVCPSAEIAERVRSIFSSATGRFRAEPGLVVRVRCNRRESETIVDRVSALSRRTAPTATPTKNVIVQQSATGRHRVMIRSTEKAESTTPHIVMVAGTSMRLTGFGQEFTAQDQHGELAGDIVRYAYYV